MAIDNTLKDSATIGTTEYSLPNDSTTLTAQTDACELEVWLDVSAMTITEEYAVRVYEKVNGGTAGAVIETNLVGVQPGDGILKLPRMIVAEGWDVTVQKIAGTDRSIGWSLRKITHLSAADIRTEMDSNSTQLAAIVAEATDTGANVDAILVDTGTTIPAQISALNNLSAAEVNAEVLDVLNTDTFSEPSGVPGASASLADKIGYLFMALRNKVTVTSTKKTFYDDSDTAEWEKDLSDDGTTYTESKGNAI